MENFDPKKIYNNLEDLSSFRLNAENQDIDAIFTRLGHCGISKIATIFYVYCKLSNIAKSILRNSINHISSESLFFVNFIHFIISLDS